MFSLWLKTYQAFTAKQLVAEITVTEIEPTNGYERIEVKYQQIESPSALDTFLSGRSEGREAAVATPLNSTVIRF